MSRFRLADNAKGTFLSTTDVFQRVGSGNERLSLAYGLIACLAWGVLAPSSAMAACGSYVTSRTTAGSTERLMKALARPDVGFPPCGPFACCPCSGLAARKSRPTPPPPLPAAVSAPHVESWAFLHRRRNPLTQRGLVQPRTGQVPAYPSNLPDSAPAPPGTLTAILSDP